MNSKVLANLLQYKAQNRGVFTEEEAAIDIALNSPEIKARALAKRWSWGKSTAARKIDLLLVAARGVKSGLGQTGTKHWEIEPESQCLGQTGTKQGDLDPQQKEGFLSPQTPLTSQEKPPSKERKEPLKGFQKKETFPPENDDSQPQPLELFSSGDEKERAPFSIRQAEVYFESRLSDDLAARQAGFQSAIMAQEFWGHWDARDWTDENGKLITSNTWKRRAATWYRYKDKYGNGKTSTTFGTGSQGDWGNVQDNPATSEHSGAMSSGVRQVATNPSGRPKRPGELSKADWLREGEFETQSEDGTRESSYNHLRLAVGGAGN